MSSATNTKPIIIIQYTQPLIRIIRIGNRTTEGYNVVSRLSSTSPLIWLTFSNSYTSIYLARKIFVQFQHIKSVKPTPHFHTS